MENHQQTIIFTNPYKSLAAAIMLSVILGPIGLLYATFVGSLIMTLLFLFVTLISFFGIKVGAFYLLFWMISIFWCVAKVNRYNKKIHAIIMPELCVKTSEK